MSWTCKSVKFSFLLFFPLKPIPCQARTVCKARVLGKAWHLPILGKTTWCYPDQAQMYSFYLDFEFYMGYYGLIRSYL